VQPRHGLDGGWEFGLPPPLAPQLKQCWRPAGCERRHLRPGSKRHNLILAMKNPIRPLPALSVCVWLAACGFRTSMDTPGTGPSIPTPGPDARLDARPDASPDVRPDVRPGPGSPPDTGPDLWPNLRPDTGPDLGPDARPDNRPDAAPETPRPREVGPDLPRDRPGPEILSVDLARDMPPDLPEVPFDLRREVRPDGNVDIKPDLPREVPVRLDGACTFGSTMPCTCDNGLSGSRICLPSLVYSECGCGTEALMRVKNGVIGEWFGTATNPWVSSYQVTFTFDSYTHYSAWSLDSRSTALYYGLDDDSPAKRYSIDDMQASGDAVGTIDIYFGPGNTVRNKLESIQLSADLNHLKFYYMHFGEYGPMQYDLVRVVP
jgi:hypothetical protein